MSNINELMQQQEGAVGADVAPVWKPGQPASDAACASTGAGGGVLSGLVGGSMILPVSITWRPQPDITPYELARLLPILLRYGHPLMPYDVPAEPDLLRHIEVRDPNKREGN